MKPDTPLDLGLFVYIGYIPRLCEVIRQPKCMCCMPAYCMSGGHEPAKVCFLYLPVVFQVFVSGVLLTFVLSNDVSTAGFWYIGSTVVSKTPKVEGASEPGNIGGRFDA